METIQKEKVKLTAKVVSQEALTDDICSMWIQADEIAPEMISRSWDRSETASR